MRLRFLRGDAGFSEERLSSVIDPDEVANLSQHTGELLALLPLDRAADLAEPERAQGAAMLRGLADLRADLRDADLPSQLLQAPSPRRAVEPMAAPRRSSCRGPSRPRPAGAGA